MTKFVRVANKGLSRPVLSTSCGLFVRVAGKGLSEWQRRIKGAKPRREVSGAGEDSADEAKIMNKSSIRRSKLSRYIYL